MDSLAPGEAPGGLMNEKTLNESSVFQYDTLKKSFSSDLVLIVVEHQHLVLRVQEIQSKDGML